MKHASLVLSFVAAFVMLPTLAHADDAAFCNNSPLALLGAIEGQWTFEQRAGYGIGGPLPFPLPAQPAQSVRIELNADEGAAYLRHAGQQMAMIPVDAVFARELDFYLSPEEEANILGESDGCDWQTIPLIVGANVYSLVAEADEGPRSRFIMQIGDEFLEKCTGTDYQLSNPPGEPQTFFSYTAANGRQMRAEVVDGKVYVSSEDEYGDRAANREWAEKYCDRLADVPDAAPGQMVMSLIVKFNSANSGAGVLQFNGQQGPVSFAARAPVILSR
ncbi:hypothetical protein SAMN04488005_1986 [Yoonia tamlensis]|uniref:Protease inhibitor Inh n=1 Tax=Yoonia tamlensis TaxID=390270 RepID=A0A1I6GPS9_9RHOB|nr:hypothetical protein [Yoonia tamlensis]SFR44057.1 hypothetical protein SAMN04488005_1986 [Yoonia tamlensis]